MDLFSNVQIVKSSNSVLAKLRFIVWVFIENPNEVFKIIITSGL